MGISPLSALGIQASAQLAGAGLGDLLGKLNRVDPNEAYQDAPQYQEFSPELEQAYQERARIGSRVDDRREGILARLLSQANSNPIATGNSSRNVAMSNAQNAQMMNTIAGVEDNLGQYEDQLESRADAMQMQGRGRLAEIMQLNSQARQQARQQAQLANRQQQTAGMATGLQLGSTMGSGIVNYSAMRNNLKFQEKQFEQNTNDRNRMWESLFGSPEYEQLSINDVNQLQGTMQGMYNFASR